jgi:hypothetical protein
MSLPARSLPARSLPATLPAAILETILGRLALLFLAGAAGDMAAARDAATQMLAAYHPETENELRLAAEIVSFSLHALEALGQASTPDMSLTKVLRLRSGAVSLSREAHKAERRLEQLQKARRAGAEAQPQATQAPPVSEPARPQIDKAIALIEATRNAIETTPRNGSRIWTQAHQKREAARRMTENLKRNQAAHAAMVNAAASAAPVRETGARLANA